MIIDEIKNANREAMKNRDANARAIYSIVMNKHLILSVDKKKDGAEVSDAETLAIIQKTIKELEEECATYANAGRTEEVENLKAQIAVLSKFLPELMSAEEIKAEIEKLEDKSIQSVMKHFKANFTGKCDMRLVQEVLKTLA